MVSVRVRELRKVFHVPNKRPGLGGALRALLSRDKKAIEAVRGISFDIQEGEVVGFLGPNGAGKTTTLKMLSGILHPTSGEMDVLGHVPFRRDPAMLRQIALVMGNKQQLWWDLPAWDGFLVLRELYGVPHTLFKERTDRLIDDLQLSDKVNTQIRKLSLGERMKCELVAALLHGPRVVFLDEPTIGLDVVSQKRIRDFLRDLNAREGCTVLLTSHYMQDVQELCRRVVVIDHGALLFDDTLEALTQRYSGTRHLRLTFAELPPSDLAQYGQEVAREDRTVTLALPRGEVAAVTSAILQALPVEDIAVEGVPIEEVVRDLFGAPRT